MCGIGGILALSPAAAAPEPESLTRMIAALRHRGPDEAGLYRDARCGLAHARLSIIDLATGQQPLANEDGTVWVSFNGEIFNYVELRAELVADGHRFATRSDTEVIVHGFEQWGEEAFARFNGQFAVALWDARAERLVLARDHMGVRPLHICLHGGRLYFASEVKAIFAAEPSIPRALDGRALQETFTYWCPLPPRTPFAGVEELPPGHVRTYDARGVRERAFWTPRFDEQPRPLEDSVREVSAALEQATSLRMLRADVPVGSYLSGGLDSSLVAALAHAVKGRGLQTFSLRFADPEYDETEFQRLMVRHLGSEHHDIVVSRRDIAEVFPRVVWHAERPMLRTAPAPLFLLSSLVQRSGIKVVLTGEGADEVFAGYDLFREAKVRRFWSRQPGSKRRPRLLERLYPYLARSPVAQRAMARQFFGRGLEGADGPVFSHEMRWQGAAALQRLFSAETRSALPPTGPIEELIASLPAEFGRWAPLARDQYLEMRTLLAGYLLNTQGDRMLMAHSVEGRFPFLDRHVVELASTLPAGHKLRGLDEKHVLKRAARGLVPPAILARKKQPYRAPDALAFTDGCGWAEEALSERAVREAGAFDPSMVARLWSKCQAQREGQLSNADNMALVGVLSTQLLWESFVRRFTVPAVEVPLRTRVDRLQRKAG